VPSKRDLLGENTSRSGPNWAEFRWNRILAFALGAGTTVLYFWMAPSRSLPDWTTAALASVPVGLLLYSLTTQSWRRCASVAAGTAIGLGLGAYV
jgi:hypothetical protein